MATKTPTHEKQRKAGAAAVSTYIYNPSSGRHLKPESKPDKTSALRNWFNLSSKKPKPEEKNSGIISTNLHGHGGRRGGSEGAVVVEAARKSVSHVETNLISVAAFLQVKVLVSDMPGFMQVHAFRSARRTYDSLEKFSSKHMAYNLKRKEVSEMFKDMTIEATQQAYLTTTPKSMGIADLGCSSGPNTLSIIKDIIEAIIQVASTTQIPHQTPTPDEFIVYLNDLPSNDFNSIFKALPDFSMDLNIEINHGSHLPIYIGGFPGSFYGRLFPNNSLHIVYASYSLHWLSRVPPALYNEQGKSINKGNVYISESSPIGVGVAYQKQFEQDFSLFLKSRSEELAVGGRVVLIMLGREGPDHVDRGNSLFWQLLSKAIAILVSKGEVEEEKLDSYDMHIYAASKDEIEEEVRKEGSFELERLEMFELDEEDQKQSGYGTSVAKTLRAVQESMIGQHFGEGILDSLFGIYATLVDEEVAREEVKPIAFGIVLKKL